MFLRNNKDNTKVNVLTIPSEQKRLTEVSSKILEYFASFGAKKDDNFDIKLCVEEAVRNAIVHGNRSDKKLPVKISYWMKDGRINIEVEDRGNGFDHKRIPDPTKGENISRNSGRGVYLIRKLMDEVEYNDIGNKVRMAKRLERGTVGP